MDTSPPARHHRSEDHGRRSFLARVAISGATFATGPAAVAWAVPARPAGAQQGDDTTLAAFAESVELALVAAYDVVADIVSSDLVPVVELFRGHHEEHAATFAELAGEAATGAANEALMATLDPLLAELGGTAAALAFARDLENQLAVTHGHALTLARGDGAVAAIATIAPIEAGHAAALSHRLDDEPERTFPTGAFESTDIALGLDRAVFPVS